jgi:hypothetical protein
MSLRIVGLEVLHESKELFASTLFEETHQIRFKSLAIGCGHFLNFITTFAKEALLIGLKHVCAVNACVIDFVLFHSRYLDTRVFSKILTSLPPLMIYLGIKSIFQSRFWPSSGGGFLPSRNSFHRLVRFSEAPSPP